MKNKARGFVRAAIVFSSSLSLFLSPIVNVARAATPSHRNAADGGIVAKLDFDPKVNGFSFENYGNDAPRKWQGDLGAEDLIRMFGPAAVCKSGTTAKDCVMKAAAHQWMEQALKGMAGGHCEGMAVTCLRFDTGLPFKSLVGPASFQPGANTAFGLKLNQSVANYIAYYFITQEFRETAVPTKATAKQGPLAIVKMLIDSMNNGSETYTLGIYKCPDCEKPDGHAITPFAVEDAGSMYKIHVYDNNFPGETRFVTVDKGGKQTWKYSSATNPNEPVGLYTGNIETATLELTASSLRDGRCFEAPFAKNDPKATGCGGDTAKPEKPVTSPKPTTPKAPVGPAPKPVTMDNESEDADFMLTGPGNMLIIDGDGKKVGFDPESGKEFDEIGDAEVDFICGGRGKDSPHYILPFDEDAKPYTVIFSGRDLKKESVMDFVYTGPGFTVGLDHIRLDPGEILTAMVSADGENIEMVHSADGEIPEIFYSMDTPGRSYSAIVKESGAKKPVKKEPNHPDAKSIEQMRHDLIADMGPPHKGETPATPIFRADFDDETGKFEISDNSDEDDYFDVDIEEFDAHGKKHMIQLNDLGKGDEGENNYEIEVGEWDGGGKIAVKHDDEGNGFDDDEEVMDQNEENDVDDDTDDDGGALMSYIYRSIDW